jgi:cysteine desulfurase / selenocysteine lyase
MESCVEQWGMPDWKAIRAQFPSLQQWVYLNTATFGQMPQSARRAVLAHLDHRDEMACSDFLAWHDDFDQLRGKLGRLCGAKAEDIAFCNNASQALAQMIHGLEWKAGDEILTLEGEFPNNSYAPALLERGVVCREVPWELFYESLNQRTRLVTMSAMSYTNGFRPPLAEVSARLRERGVLWYLDATQGITTFPIDCAALRPSMLAVHGYKWLLSPTGAGFYYVDPDLRRSMKPIVVGWRTHEDWRNVSNLHHGMPRTNGQAEQYEGGGLSAALLYMMEASVDLILETGLPEIEQRISELTARVRTGLRLLGAEVLSDLSPLHLGPIVAARWGGLDAKQLAGELQKERVLLSARHGWLRISLHFYNNEADCDALLSQLEKSIAVLRSSTAA